MPTLFSRPMFPALAACLCAASPAIAGPLQVEPVLVEVATPGAASTITLRSDGSAPVDAQIRVFRWSQTNGEERLEPTDEVVASPPAVSLKGGSPHVVRIVRVKKAPIVREESYRLVVDQLPNLAQQRSGTVNMILRHSIPVFFKPQSTTSPSVAWSVGLAAGKLALTARNTGERRLRISALEIRDSSSRTIAATRGLVGYVLGGSTMRWMLPAGQRDLAQGGRVSIIAQGDTGPIHASAPVASSGR